MKRQGFISTDALAGGIITALCVIMLGSFTYTWQKTEKTTNILSEYYIQTQNYMESIACKTNWSTLQGTTISLSNELTATHEVMITEHNTQRIIVTFDGLLNEVFALERSWPYE